MKPLVSIIMGSTSDLPVMEKAFKLLDEMQVPFEVNALSAHRTPDAVEEFARTAKDRGIKVIIAGAGMAGGLPHQPLCPLSVCPSRVCSTAWMPCFLSSRCPQASLLLQ